MYFAGAWYMKFGAQSRAMNQNEVRFAKIVIFIAIDKKYLASDHFLNNPFSIHTPLNFAYW
jgi:hypothetical protein